MSEIEKTIRLSKVARELNIGVHTIVDFLGSKGLKVDNNPNTKITEEGYRLLLKEFQSEKTAKEESQLLNLNKKKESVVLEADTAPKPAERKEPEQEILIKNSYTPEFNKDKKAPAKEKPADDIIKANVDNEISLKVVGKIDLDSLSPKKAEKKKEEAPAPEASEPKPEQPREEPADSPAPASDPVQEPVAGAAPAAPVADTPKPPATQPPPVKEEELYRTTRDKLSGPTILGKIELPIVKKPVASSSSFLDDKKKKKRKRTSDKKPDQPDTGGAQRPAGAGGFERKKFEPRKFDNKRGGGAPSAPKAEPTEKEIQEQIKATLARLSGGGKSKGAKHRKLRRENASQLAEEEKAMQEQQRNVIQVTEFVSANELSKLMNVPVTDIISTCMSLGIFVSINQRLDAETLAVVADEFGHKVEFVSADVQEAIEQQEDREEDLRPRAPIVTVMGHVDHGKTSLLDYVRKTNVIAGEAGGITQHIGAYEVKLENGKRITFLDTPGHEAFTAMRARGAKVTDVAIIVIAADDSVMPQTVEAINHAQAAGVPLVFAINKIDKPGADPNKIKEALANMNILVEDWGGKYQCQEISAKKGLNVDLLLEKVLLEAEILDLKANPHKNASGTIIESSLDKGRGYVSTILVQTGTLSIGDVLLAGCYSGRVKAMFNERGARIEKAGPSSPALILGMSGAPQAGDTFNVLSDEREARDIANKRMQLQREQGIRTQKHITLDEIGRRLAIGNFKELNVIVKGDVDGSIEALSDSLLKLSTEEIQVNVIHKSVGQITESDVLLASASNAIIIGFQVRPSANARKLAEQEQIDIRLYSIIYDAIDEVKAAMEGMLAPEFEEKITCTIEVRETFKIPKVGTIAGCMVQSGKVTRNTKVRIIRDGIVIHTGELASLKRFKDDVKEVNSGYECGLNIEKFNDIATGDIIEGYENIAVKRTLA
jgi:translation initiation factor IF-2